MSQFKMTQTKYVGKVRQMGDKVYITVPSDYRAKIKSMIGKDVKVTVEEVL